MTKYKTIIVILICCMTSFVAKAQKDNTDIYTNFEKNYNDLLQSYYMQQNEKLLNLRFNHSRDNISSEYRAANVSDSVFAKRLRSVPSAVNLVYNDKVRNNIIYYIDRIGDRVGVMLGLSKYYFPIFEDILDSYNIPSELKYLVVIESAFNPKAISRTGASGLWQFMYATGRTYDLRVNSVVDDRRDPIKATVAAAKYLKDLYKIYNDWSLVLAAYNCGPGNVNKAIKRSGKNDFWGIYNYLPNETRNYVPSYIAAVYVMNFYKEHNIEPVNLSRPLDLVTDTVIVKKDIYFSQIEAVMNISVAELRDLNPQYKMDMIPGSQDRYSLKLPLKYINQFIDLEDSIANYKKEEYQPQEESIDSTPTEICYVSKTIYHKVQRNDSWYSIANRYGVSQQDLRSWNRKIKRNKLKKGTLIAVKTKVAVEKEKIIKKESPTNEPVFEENIVSADNSANQEEIEPTVINNKSSYSRNKIKKDTKKNSKDREYTKKNRRDKKDRNNDSKAENHKIKSGETISQIAKKYGVSEEQLLKANNLDKQSAKNIRPGQKLKIDNNKSTKDKKNSKSTKKSKRRRR
jgi:membrane-bound lytic murein transglycosylase D